MNKNYVGEIAKLKEKIEKSNMKVAAMKKQIKVLTTGNKQEMESIKLIFLSKKSQLTGIINALKSKLNSLNKEVD